MDPSVAWCGLAQAVADAKWEEAAEIAQNLLTWLEKDGFPPIITTVAVFDRIAAMRTCEAIVKWEV